MMPENRPFKRTCRAFVNGSYEEGGHWHYVYEAGFALSPEHYIRAFNIIQKDLLLLFDFVEPSDTKSIAIHIVRMSY
jgi:hypothetical protein